MKLDLSVEDRPFAPGEWIRGRVEVVEGGRSRRLTVMLHHRDSTSDYTGTIQTIETAALHSGDLTAPASLGNYNVTLNSAQDIVPVGIHGTANDDAVGGVSSGLLTDIALAAGALGLLVVLIYFFSGRD